MSKIMVVDDSQFMRMRLTALLSQYSHEVVQAENGEEAVQIYRQIQPDAVLMDIIMPQKDGLTALSEIRQFDPQGAYLRLGGGGRSREKRVKATIYPG